MSKTKGHTPVLLTRCSVCFVCRNMVLTCCARSRGLQDMQRPLYMRPLDAIEYGVIDRLVPPQKELEIIDQVLTAYKSQQGSVVSTVLCGAAKSWLLPAAPQDRRGCSGSAHCHCRSRARTCMTRRQDWWRGRRRHFELKSQQCACQQNWVFQRLCALRHALCKSLDEPDIVYLISTLPRCTHSRCTCKHGGFRRLTRASNRKQGTFFAEHCSFDALHSRPLVAVKYQQLGLS